MEFCQLQFNFLDWTMQHGKEKYELQQQQCIPLWVMEPVRASAGSRQKFASVHSL